MIFKDKFPHLSCFSELHLQLKVWQKKTCSRDEEKKISLLHVEL